MGGAAGDMLGQSKIGGKWKNMEFSAKKTRSSVKNEHSTVIEIEIDR